MELIKMADDEKNLFIQPDYQKMYHKLFNAMNDATNQMIQAMRECEEMYVTCVENPKKPVEKVNK